MKQLSLIIGFLSIVACGGNFKSVKYSGSASGSNLSTGINTNTSENVTPIIDASGAAVVAQDLLPALLNMFKSFQNTANIDFTKPSQVITANQSAACPLGGTISASANGTLNLSVNLTSASGSVNNGTGNLIFTNCMIAPGVALNGTVSLMAFNASLMAALNLSTDNNTYLVNGSHQLVGNLIVSYSGKTQSCALAISDTLSSTGNFHILTATSSGTVNAALTGTACGFPINQTLTQTF